MKGHNSPLFWFLLSLPIILQGQSGNSYSLSIKKIDIPVLLDGQLLEAVWEEAALAKDFFQDYPFDTSYASSPTEVRVCFDDQFLYIGATVFQKRADYIISSLKRDFDFGESDEFHANIDPFNDKLNGFHFAVSPLNVQREGLTDNGANVNMDWDNKWYSQVHNEEDRWTVEMAIPFKTLRYKNAGANTWRINFVRIDLKQNEVSSWVPVPRQFDANSLAFTGDLIWEDAPPQPGLNISLIPYLTGSTERDFEFELPAEYHANGGLDAKIALTPSLNLDLTINPDFSQVEVDRQITNLSRFELFFPERRQFFLENQDLFSMFGFPNSRPFFSRRIGLAGGTIKKTTTSGQVIEVDRLVSVPILAGARLSGKLNPNWRIGLLNMTTGAQKDLSLGPANYTVGVLQRKIFERSTIGAVFVNKESFQENPNGDGYRHDATGYNRLAGLEYNLYSKDNKWEAEVFYHRSISAGDNKDAQAAAVFLGYFPRKWRVFLPAQYIGSNHRADMGFVPRTGFLSLGPGLNYVVFPKNPKVKEKIIQYTIGISNDFVFNRPDYQLTDRRHGLFGEIQFNGQSELSVGVSSEYIYLFFPFDPTNSGGKELPAGSDYTFQQIGMDFDSDQRKNFFFNLDLGAGQYFNGRIFHAGGSLYYRLQPYGIFGLSFARDDIQLPDPYNSARFWLIGPRAELSFSRSLFFSMFLQYNTQANNVNINSRLQWRFLPVSDLFLVYTDNYLTDTFFFDFPVKNRALVLKVTYWLNL